MIKNYIHPAVEEVDILEAEVLNASGDGEIDGYGEGQEFTW